VVCWPPDMGWRCTATRRASESGVEDPVTPTSGPPCMLVRRCYHGGNPGAGDAEDRVARAVFLRRSSAAWLGGPPGPSRLRREISTWHLGCNPARKRKEMTFFAHRLDTMRTSLIRIFPLLACPWRVHLRCSLMLKNSFRLSLCADARGCGRPGAS